MCGIAGIYNYGRSEPVSRKTLEDMNDRLIHRGPDDAGIHIAGKIGIAMRRLAIIDLTQGRQPMTNEDKSLWIVFNGEIYNYLDLRSELKRRGHPFKTSSDTEVILHLYEEMGADCVQKLRGMFAFAIWDEKKQRLFLARDRFGKKPLIYHCEDGRFSWASEIQALISLPWVSKEMDLDALDLYLGLQYIPSPRTIYRSVRKLPPAHTLTLENNSVSIRRYWAPPAEKSRSTMSLEETEDAILKSLKEATSLRMISDVPLGAFLSGGLDSTCVVGLMNQLSSRPVKTFSIGFEEEEYSELPYAREAAKHFGTDHTEFVVKPNMIDVLPKLAKHYGEPFGDCSAFATYFLARETRKHVTVALNGDGGDENFAGYRRYIPVKWDFFPSANRYLRLIGIFNPMHKAELYGPDLRQAVRAESAQNYLGEFLSQGRNLDSVNRWLYVDMQSYLPECLMTKVDIATMAHSLEARSPMLDHVFVELTSRIRGSWKLKGLFQSKWIFRRAIRRLVPAALINRKKMGFGIPLRAWFRGELKGIWLDAVMASGSVGRRYFQVPYLKKLIEEHCDGKKDHGYRLWNLLMLEYWNRSVA